MARSKYGFSDDPVIDEYLEKERQRLKKQFIKEYGAKLVTYPNAGITHFLMDKRGFRGVLHDPWQMNCNDDHISFWKDKSGKKIAVSQPYHLDEEMLAHIVQRCEKARLTVNISGAGWHYPCNTALVVYRKKPTNG